MMPFADEDTDVKRQMGEPSLRALGHLLHEYPSPTVGDDEPETGCRGQMGPLVCGGQSALDGSALVRRVASRRRGRCELSLTSAMISLLRQEPGLYEHLCVLTSDLDHKKTMSRQVTDAMQCPALSEYPLFRMDQVEQVTHIFHTQDFTQFKFDPKGSFHLADQLDMAQRIPLFYILSGHFSSKSDIVFLENFLEHRL